MRVFRKTKNLPHPDLELKIFGGGQEVTGSNYLLQSPKTKILIDCGLFQGAKVVEEKNEEPFPYNPSEIETLFVTHAHLDHIGRIPKLIREGFRGKIFSTPATRDFAALMLEDSLGVMEKEAKRHRKELIYSERDIRAAMERWEGLEYYQEINVGDFKVSFKDAGHILGSAMVEIVYKGRKIVFTGDLGNPPNPLIRDTDKITDANFIIMESTYGDREHEPFEEAQIKLERTIEDTVHQGGALMIPAFSLERTQKLLFEINKLVEHGRVPRVPIFLDSPLAIKATRIYRQYQRYYNERAKEIILSGDDLFNFPGLKLTLKTEESKAINEVPNPKIIIAGSGMSNGGRIIHHEKLYLPDPKSTLLLIGYQAVGSLGRLLQEGAKRVTILGDSVPVRAKIENIRGYSAHPDMNQLYDFVSNSVDTLEKVFVVQGEPKSALFFVQRIRDYLAVEAVAPKDGQNYVLN